MCIYIYMYIQGMYKHVKYVYIYIYTYAILPYLKRLALFGLGYSASKSRRPCN